MEAPSGGAPQTGIRFRKTRGRLVCRLAEEVIGAAGAAGTDLPKRFFVDVAEIADALPRGGEPLAFVEDDWPERPAVVALPGGEVVFGFDAAEALARALAEQAREPPPPVTRLLPFHYHRVPGRLRLAIARALARIGRGPGAVAGGGRDGGVPDADDGRGGVAPASADSLRFLIARARELAGGPAPPPLWPEGKRYAVCLTHDVDTAEGQRRIGFFRALEARHGTPSTWFLVPFGYDVDDGACRALLAEGCEVGCHGYDHDNRLAYLPPPVMEERLAAAAARLRPYGPRVGFRACSLARTRALLEALPRHFDWDSSVPTEGEDGRSGATTVFPFARPEPAAQGALGGRDMPFVELPIAVPFDATLLFRGLAPRAILAAWQAAIARVKRAGGLAMVVTHPEPHFSGNPAMLDVYGELLAAVASDPDAYVATAGTIARRFARAQAPSQVPVQARAATTASG